MSKRGQVSVFIILGILVLGIIGILYYAISKDYIKTPFVSTGTVSVRDSVENCIAEIGNEAIDTLGKQSGDINPNFYQTLCINSEECYKVSYLCYTEDTIPCVNRRPFLAQHIEREIENYVDENLADCVDIGLWEDSGYSVNLGEYKSKASIGMKDTLIVVDWPITIRKGDFVEREERFSYEFNIPLGLLSEVAYDIVDSEITAGDFWVVPYVESKHGAVEIEKHRPGNSKVYALNAFQDSYKFYFAVQGWVI